MTAKELENIIPLRNEIKQLKRDIRNAQPLRDITKGSSAEHPFLEHYDVIEGDTDKVLDDKTRLKQCRVEHDRLIAYIDSVQDSLIRQILRYRYVQGLSFQSVAFKIGHYDEQYPRKKLMRFFRKYEKYEFPNV